ncbi:MAG: DNA repair protein RecN [Actinomycetes bacterium]
MLEEIRITGLGVIDEAVIELGPGLNAVSGETGAGKTMVVSGLGLLLGARADAGLVRAGAKRAVVEGTLRVAGIERALELIDDLDADVEDDGTLLVARTVSADGRSRAFVGGRTVPVSVLADLMALLVAVHGQADQMRLRQAASHRELIDEYAGDAVARPLAVYTTAYHRRHEVAALLHDITTRTQERAREADALRFGLDEIAAVSPEPGEDTTLATEIARLSHIDLLQTATASARRELLGDVEADNERGAQTLLAAAKSALDDAAPHDPAIAALADRLREAEIVVADVGADLASYLSSLDADPGRLSATLDRRASLGRLARKYATGEGGVAGVLAWARAAAERLQELDHDDDVAGLSAELAGLDAELAALAEKISTARCVAAKKLERAVAAELGALAMSEARLSVVVRSGTPGPAGADEVEIQLAAHAGAPPRPLQKAASGGELSRIMLALEVVLAGRDPVPTFVFDEVDAGVGGRAAAEVGRRLARLAATAQVVVVTHLPQVAAFADRHLLVEKAAATSGAVVSSDVIALDDGGRVIELSRMLAGQTDSEHARGHAEELLAAAAADRGSAPR